MFNYQSVYVFILSFLGENQLPYNINNVLGEKTEGVGDIIGSLKKSVYLNKLEEHKMEKKFFLKKPSGQVHAPEQLF